MIVSIELKLIVLSGFYKQSEAKLAKLQRKLARRQKGSANYKKLQLFKHEKEDIHRNRKRTSLLSGVYEQALYMFKNTARRLCHARDKNPKHYIHDDDDVVCDGCGDVFVQYDDGNSFHIMDSVERSRFIVVLLMACSFNIFA